MVEGATASHRFGATSRTEIIARVPDLRRTSLPWVGGPFEVDLESGRPFNPMVNTGAILTTSLVPGGLNQIRDGLSRFAGRPLDVNPVVHTSERDTGDRNRAIAYLMRNFGMLEGDVDACLEAYFGQCSVEVDVSDLATMAATLARGGINPVTDRRAMREQHVPQVLSAGPPDRPAGRGPGGLRAVGGAEPGTVAAIEAVGTQSGHEDGDVLFRAGEPADTIHFVLSGTVGIRRGSNATGRIAAEGPGAAVGDLAAPIDSTRTATVVCGSDTTSSR